jgi:hypothetical protein
LREHIKNLLGLLFGYADACILYRGLEQSDLLIEADVDLYGAGFCELYGVANQIQGFLQEFGLSCPA